MQTVRFPGLPSAVNPSRGVMLKVSPSRDVGALMAKMSKCNGKPRKAALRSDGRTYPTFKAGMSTAHYVARYAGANAWSALEARAFFGALNPEPCTLYTGEDLHETIDDLADRAPMAEETPREALQGLELPDPVPMVQAESIKAPAPDPVPCAYVSADIAAWLDPAGALQAAGLMRAHSDTPLRPVEKPRESDTRAHEMASGILSDILAAHTRLGALARRTIPEMIERSEQRLRQQANGIRASGLPDCALIFERCADLLQADAAETEAITGPPPWKSEPVGPRWGLFDRHGALIDWANGHGGYRWMRKRVGLLEWNTDAPHSVYAVTPSQCASRPPTREAIAEAERTSAGPPPLPWKNGLLSMPLSTVKNQGTST